MLKWKGSSFFDSQCSVRSQLQRSDVMSYSTVMWAERDMPAIAKFLISFCLFVEFSSSCAIKWEILSARLLTNASLLFPLFRQFFFLKWHRFLSACLSVAMNLACTWTWLDVACRHPCKTSRDRWRWWLPAAVTAENDWWGSLLVNQVLTWRSRDLVYYLQRTSLAHATSAQSILGWSSVSLAETNLINNTSNCFKNK